MKKNRERAQKFIVIIASLIVLIVLAGCSGRDALVGEWRLESGNEWVLETHSGEESTLEMGDYELRMMFSEYRIGRKNLTVFGEGGTPERLTTYFSWIEESSHLRMAQDFYHSSGFSSPLIGTYDYAVSGSTLTITVGEQDWIFTRIGDNTISRSYFDRLFNN